MMITRFAPSPTGYLHLGHAYSAWLNYSAAHAEQGRFLLRLEDIDQTRCRPEFYAAIEEDLAWLGLTWETPLLVQSQHLPRYETALADLHARGLVYRCFKSRKDIAEAMAAPHAQMPDAYFGAPDPHEADKLAADQPFAWRLNMQGALRSLTAPLGITEITGKGMHMVEADPRPFGDAVLGRKDSGTSYHLASVLDDALQGVTHVIRGEELREAAFLHRLLQQLLGLPAPIYRHHPMLTNAAGVRLSKRDGAASIRAMRDAGLSPAQVLAQAAIHANGRVE